MKIFVTFGQAHIHKVNGKIFDKDCVAVIEAKDHGSGKKEVFELFGDKFFTTYADIKEVSLEYFPRGIMEVRNEISRI